MRETYPGWVGGRLIESRAERRFHALSVAIAGANRNRNSPAVPHQRTIAMPKTIKVGVITQEGGAHLPDYFGSLAKIEAVEAVALSDPSGNSVELARKELGDKLKGVHKD